MQIISALALLTALTLLLMSSVKKTSKKSDHKIPVITRIWRGWTTEENANAFEKTLTEVAIPGIERNRPEGCLSIQLLRRESGNEVEFTTIMLFRTVESIKKFAGEDYESAHIDPEVKPLLLRYDARVAHHETLYRKVWEQGE